jgi:hypothetical protein
MMKKLNLRKTNKTVGLREINILKISKFKAKAVIHPKPKLHREALQFGRKMEFRSRFLLNHSFTNERFFQEAYVGYLFT